MASASIAPSSEEFAAAERTARYELAACYRLCALFGWDDHVATHLTARLSDNSFLINRFGLMFDEVTASNLIRVNLAGEVLDPPGEPLNAAGFTVHGGLLANRPDVMAAMHLHSRDGVAVSALEEGLLPLSQNVLNIWHDVAYHEYDGIVLDPQEGEKLARDLGDKNILILRNHGTLSVGRTIAEAFIRIYMLEWACTAQVRTLGMGRPLHMPTPEVSERHRTFMSSEWIHMFANHRFWPAMLRKAERDCPGFAE